MQRTHGVAKRPEDVASAPCVARSNGFKGALGSETRDVRDTCTQQCTDTSQHMRNKRAAVGPLPWQRASTSQRHLGWAAQVGLTSWAGWAVGLGFHLRFLWWPHLARRRRRSHLSKELQIRTRVRTEANQLERKRHAKQQRFSSTQ